MNPQATGRLIERLFPNGAENDYIELRDLNVADLPFMALCQVREGELGRTVCLTKRNEAELLRLLRERSHLIARTTMGEEPQLLTELSANTRFTRVDLYDTAVGPAAMMELRLVYRDTPKTEGRSIYLTPANQAQLLARLERGRPENPDYHVRTSQAADGNYVRCRACGQPTALREGRNIPQAVCSIPCAAQKKLRANEFVESLVFMDMCLRRNASAAAAAHGLSWAQANAILKGF